MNPLQTLIQKVVSGDLAAFQSLLGTNPPEWNTLAGSGVTFVVTAPAVRSVLMALASNAYPVEVFCQWAWFMRSGVPSGLVCPCPPMSIDYALSHEEPISHAVCRLSELGDFVDGEISDAELAELCQALSQPTEA